MITASDAIRTYCAQCSPEEPPSACTAKHCRLWPYRSGGKSASADALVRVIRRECWQCMGGGSPAGCTSPDCALWPYHTPAAEAAMLEKKE